MTARAKTGSASLLVSVLLIAAALGAWKNSTLRAAEAAAAAQPEPVEAVTAATAVPRDYQPTGTSIGTVQALRSITLRNEVPGTVRRVNLEPGQVVEAGTVLVALDVAVEEAELEALRAEAGLADSVLERTRRLLDQDAVSQEQLDRALADRDIARARIARTQAVIERKTIRAPFRARVGIADVHPGQYLNEGSLLTTLQGVADAAHVDFTVEQAVAGRLAEGSTVDIVADGDGNGDGTAVPAAVVGVDSRVDPTTRNATVRARIDNGDNAPKPGASVRVRFPSGEPRSVVAIPSSAVRKGPTGDHVFVLAMDGDGTGRAEHRQVEVVARQGDVTLVGAGLEAGEQVATSGSFKLREDVLVALAANPAGTPGGGR